MLFYVEGRFGHRMADRVFAELEAALKQIAMHAGEGTRREDLTSDPSIRFWEFGLALIAYRPSSRPLAVLFIERGEDHWWKSLGGGAA